MTVPVPSIDPPPGSVERALVVVGQTSNDIIRFSDGTERHMFDLRPGPEQRAFRRFVDELTQCLRGGPTEPEEPHHAAARQRTDGEQAALLAQCLGRSTRDGLRAVGGVYPVPDGVESGLAEPFEPEATR